MFIAEHLGPEREEAWQDIKTRYKADEVIRLDLDG